ncbi:MAG: nucleotidyltransferase family protein [Acidobacteria bacterium]|nr:nucleotidyltransferase family protein [Acidobacteriota bacterium]
MGRDKALLPLGERTFLSHLIAVLQGEVAPVVVVLGHHAAEIAKTLTAPSETMILRNPIYRLGQLSSLQVALRPLENQGIAGALVCLVDHPAVSKKVVRELVERFQKSAAPVVIPTCNGRRGHPVLFSRSVFPELLQAPLEEGARAVVRRHGGEIEFVAVNEAGVLLDVDVPADYEALLTQWAELTGPDDELP